jgi:formylglycine-generating enzyme required for sulfatase activity
MKIFPKKSTIFIIYIVLALFFTVTSSSAAPVKAVETIVGIEFVRIKAGSFVMGDIYAKGMKFERPTHKVTLKPFYIGQFEVTFDQYDAFCSATGRAKPNDEGWGRGQRPVINVTWKDAVAYADWLSKKTGRKIRLPSESEWEYAARAGKSSPYWWGHSPGVNLANCSDCLSKKPTQTTPVGSFSPSPFGLYDMNGNVYEFVADDWHENYDGAPTDGSAWLDGDSKNRVSRGGCWYYGPADMAVYKRNWDFDEPYNYQGFRVVLEP